MRFISVSTQRNWHGGEQQAFLLLQGLARRGHQVAALARRDGEFARRLSEAGITVGTFAGRGRSPRSLWAIRRELQRFGPDVLHFNDGHALTSGGVASLKMPGVLRLAARRVDYELHSLAKYRWLADRVICVSQAIADVCSESGISHDQLCVVHSGVDPARVAAGQRQRGRDALGLSDSDLLLLCVANLTDHKGHRYLIDALPGISQTYPKVRLALAGDGDLAEKLKRQVARLGLAQIVDFLGYRQDVADLIQACDLFVHPSHMEGLGTTLIDVMLARRPIVSTTAGGIPELLGPEHGRGAAYLATPHSVDDLRQGICQTLANDNRTQIEIAYQRAMRAFTHDAMVEKTLAVIAEAQPSVRAAA